MQYCITNPEEMALNGLGDLGLSMKALSALNVDIDPWPCDLADCDRVPVIVRGVRALTRAWKALTATPAPRFDRVARVAFDMDDTTDWTQTVRTQYLNRTLLAPVLCSQFPSAVVRHKANNGIFYATHAWFKHDNALSAVA